MIRRALVAVSCLSLAAASYAESWQILGPRAMGMGGAGVAAAVGGVAQYWNPASLAQEATNAKWGVQIPVGVRGEFTGNTLKDANVLGDLANKFSKIQNAQTSGKALDANTIAAFAQGITAISDMNEPGTGALADVAGGAEFKIGRFNFSINNFTSIGGDPSVDTTNIGLGGATGVTGINFSGVSAAAPADTASRNQIQAAIDTIGFGNLNTLVCGSAACISGVTQNPAINNSLTLANALVNQAITNGASATDIQNAATTLQQNAATAAPLVANAATGNAYTNNQTRLVVRGASFTELAMGYGHQVFVPGLLVGGNLKAIVGNVGYTRFDVLQNNTGSSNALKDFRSNSKQSVRPGIDAGVLWDVDQLVPVAPFKPRLGIVARNINNPKFDQPQIAIDNGEASKYPLNSQVRAGLAITPANFWNIAADFDLTKNLTPLPGYASRMVGIGTEINVFNRSWINIPLRAGLMKNIADSNSKLSYTAGFGANFLHCMLDVGGSISSKTTEIKSGDTGTAQKVPENASLAVQLALMF